MKFTQKPLHIAMVGVFVGLLAAGQPALADDRESLDTLRETTLNLIDALVEQGIFSREKADAMVKAAQSKAAKIVTREKSKSAAPVRVQYVPETVKNEIRDQLRQEVLAQAKAERWAEPNAVPSWLDRIKWEGDIRVRYQMEEFAKSNATPDDYFLALTSSPETTRAAGFIPVSANTQTDRERFRVRARLGMLAKVSDDWSAGVRLATGTTSDRVSTNQTMGQDFNKYQFLVDRAYVKYDPVEWFSVTGGRVPNPWLSTDLVWDEDLNFEGFAATLKPSFANGDFRPFLTIGAFPLREDGPPSKGSRWLRGAQLGAKWQLMPNSRLSFGVALYDYENLEGRPETQANYQSYQLGGSATYGQYEYGSGLRQKGNTLFDTAYQSDTNSIWGLASKFRPVNLTASLDLAHFDPVHVVLTADYVKNTAFDRSEIQRRTGVALTDGKDYGYLFKLAVGMPKLEKRHDWQGSFAYRYLGSDATVDAFTDSDFGLGGTNLKGYQLGLNYGVDQNAWLSLRWMSAQSIESFSLDPAHRFGVDLLQADVNVRF
ncbi:putative porin [Dechloromonas sp.]|uniref:putative porin n=1 Tax=Dechloromonas sp. TaxID=1917218 RepID=UPI00286E57E1|nr:putative porin [Dechloromonas sp.]